MDDDAMREAIHAWGQAEIRYWAVDDGELTGFDDVIEWGRFIEEHPASMQVENEAVVSTDGKRYQVSTICLGVDMALGPFGPPRLFETAILELLDTKRLTWIFGGHRMQSREWLWSRRYSTLEQAQRGHVDACAALLNGFLPDDE